MLIRIVAALRGWQAGCSPAQLKELVKRAIDGGGHRKSSTDERKGDNEGKEKAMEGAHPQAVEEAALKASELQLVRTICDKDFARDAREGFGGQQTAGTGGAAVSGMFNDLVTHRIMLEPDMHAALMCFCDFFCPESQPSEYARFLGELHEAVFHDITAPKRSAYIPAVPEHSRYRIDPAERRRKTGAELLQPRTRCLAVGSEASQVLKGVITQRLRHSRSFGLGVMVTTIDAQPHTRAS